MHKLPHHQKFKVQEIEKHKPRREKNPEMESQPESLRIRQEILADQCGVADKNSTFDSNLFASELLLRPQSDSSRYGFGSTY